MLRIAVTIRFMSLESMEEDRLWDEQVVFALGPIQYVWVIVRDEAIYFCNGYKRKWEK